MYLDFLYNMGIKQKMIIVNEHSITSPTKVQNGNYFKKKKEKIIIVANLFYIYIALSNGYTCTRPTAYAHEKPVNS